MFLEEVSHWMKENGLKLASSKTESVILKRKIDRRDIICFKMREYEIRPSKTVKYLGASLDGKISYTDHVKRVIEQHAEEDAFALVFMRVYRVRLCKSLLE